MRLLICVFAAAGIIGLSGTSPAADEKPYTSQPKYQKPGRSIDDGTVTTGKPKKFGREIDNGPFGTERPKKYGREIDDGSVKTSKKPKEHGRAIEADNAVKTKRDPNKPGRAVQEEKK
jgi:hypothetical protein